MSGSFAIELAEKSVLIKRLTQHNRAELHSIWYLPKPIVFFLGRNC